MSHPAFRRLFSFVLWFVCSFALVLVLLLAVGCATAQTPPEALQNLVSEEWDGPSEVQLWTTPSQDSAFVFGQNEPQFFRAHLANGATWIRCPETANQGEPYPLEAIRDSAEVVVRERRGLGINGILLPLSECATTIAAIEDSIRSDE